MAENDRVAIVTADLMFDSRLRAALRSSGHEVVTVRGSEVAGAALVFVDLNSDAAGRLEIIEVLHREHPAVTIVGFCHHGEKELRKSAMARGADLVVTNDAVPAAARRALGLERGVAQGA